MDIRTVALGLILAAVGFCFTAIDAANYLFSHVPMIDHLVAWSVLGDSRFQFLGYQYVIPAFFVIAYVGAGLIAATVLFGFVGNLVDSIRGIGQQAFQLWRQRVCPNIK